MVHDTCAVQFTWRKDILQVLTTAVIMQSNLSKWLCGWSQVTYRSRSCVIPNLSCEGTWAGMDWCQDAQGKVTSLGPRLIDQIWPWEETVSTVPSQQSWMFTANYCKIRDTVANPCVSYQAKQVYPGVGGCKEFQVKGQLAVPDHISPRCPVP